MGLRTENLYVFASQEDMYALYCFLEERMADYLKMGTRMPPEQLYKVMSAMYALKDATLKLQEGEIVDPRAAESAKPA